MFNKTHLGAGPGAVTPSRERFGEALEAKGSSLTSYAASFDKAVEQFESIDALWDSLRFWASCFSATMMVRFFKAFRPNPRMNRVARTLVMAWSDLMHFVIVFAAVCGFCQICQLSSRIGERFGYKSVNIWQIIQQV